MQHDDKDDWLGWPNQTDNDGDDNRASEEQRGLASKKPHFVPYKAMPLLSLLDEALETLLPQAASGASSLQPAPIHQQSGVTHPGAQGTAGWAY